MKKINIILSCAAMAIAAGCSFLDPLANGNYTESNIDDYPTLVRGYITQAYKYLPSTYLDDEFAYTDAFADNLVMRSKSDSRSLFATGAGKMSSCPLDGIWEECYRGIYYCNLFLENNVGFNTRYLIDNDVDMVLRHSLQGDAFGLRAWYLATLIRFYGGKGTDGNLLGVPVLTSPVKAEKVAGYDVVRASYDDCVKQIIADCDSALRHLPLANRDFLNETTQFSSVVGAVRYKSLDCVSIHALKALVYLTWASPAFNPSGDKSRYKLAAEEAYTVIQHKLTKENVNGGFDPKANFLWTDPNSPEAIFVSDTKSGSTFETSLYPYHFHGSSKMGPTQELVDAFPMANGYPIDDSRSGYDEHNPYAGRDPRFYSTIYYDGAEIIRSSTGQSMYNFDIADGGDDAIGGETTSPTGYYVKKFLYKNWNSEDATVQTATRNIFFLRWTHMCLAFAEAANKYAGPLDTELGMSAKQALSYLRSRKTNDGENGLGAVADPYLDECAAAGEDAFDSLVKNEWRLETCFEGRRFHDLRRWGSLDDVNRSVSGVIITTSGNNVKDYARVVVEKRNFKSLWLPIPYLEMRKNKHMVQNEGWENYK